MDSRVGIVGFSFGLRSKEEEPNPSNLALAFEVAEAKYFVELCGSQPVIVTQWEITKSLAEAGTHPIRSVELHDDGTYLGSESVWEAAKAEFENCLVHQVIIIAQPFLHLPSLKKMASADGYEVMDYEISRSVPFDKSPRNTQPWTRSKLALTIYAMKAVLGLKRGHGGMQNAK